LFSADSGNSKLARQDCLNFTRAEMKQIAHKYGIDEDVGWVK